MPQTWNLTTLEKTLIRQEGFKPEPYRDSENHLTLGIGRKDARLSLDEAVYLLRNDLRAATENASRHYFFWHLNQARQDVIVNLIFNIGYRGFLHFEKMIAALEVHNYSRAAEELLDSRWAIQVGKSRSTEMANQLRSGRYEE